MKSPKRRSGREKSVPKNVVKFEPPLRVYGYIEDGEWVAHCLETDLIGIGPTFPEAVEVLRAATAAQYGFAKFKGQPGLFYHPAPMDILESYTRLVTEQLERLGSSPDNPGRAVAAFLLPAAASGKFALAACD